MTDLGPLLRTLAGQAPEYPVEPETLVRRRQRRRAWWAASCAAVGVLGVLLAGATALDFERPDSEVAPTPRSSVYDSAAGLCPARVDPLPANPAPLPADRGVGPASLVVQHCANCPVLVVLPDGTMFQVPVPDAFGDPPTLEGMTLSPDGRWLGWTTDHHGGYVLRNLLGTGERRWPRSTGVEPVTWSADGRWLLLLVRSTDSYEVFDTSTGQSRPAAVPGDTGPGRDWRVDGILPTGELLAVRAGTAAESWPANRVPVRIIDPSGGQIRREVSLQTDRMRDPAVPPSYPPSVAADPAGRAYVLERDYFGRTGRIFVTWLGNGGPVAVSDLPQRKPGRPQLSWGPLIGVPQGMLVDGRDPSGGFEPMLWGLDGRPQFPCSLYGFQDHVPRGGT